MNEESSSEEIAGAVGLAHDHDREFWVEKRKIVEPLAPANSTVFLHAEGEAVLGVLNFGEDAAITHETESIRVWDLERKEQLCRFGVAARMVKRYASWLFCVESEAEELLQFDLRDDSLRPTRFGGVEGITAIQIGTFVESGMMLFAITRESLAFAWKAPASGERHETAVPVMVRFEGHTSNVTSLDLGDRYLYTSSTDRTIRVWDYRTGQCLQVLVGHTDWVFSAKVIDGRVFSGSRDETLRVWSDKGECLQVIRLGSVAYGVQLDENRLFVRDALKRVVLYEGGKKVGSAEGSPGNVLAMVHFRNVFVTIAQADTVLRVWSSEDGSCLAHLRGHTDAVNAIVGFGTGVIFSASDDGTVRQWDLFQVFEGHMGKPPAREKLKLTMHRRLTERVVSVKEKVTLRIRGLEGAGTTSPRRPESPKQLSPRQRGGLAGLWARESEPWRPARSQSVGVVERKSPDAVAPGNGETPRGSHANFGSSEPLVAPKAIGRTASLLSPRLRRNTADISVPFNVTHTAGGVDKIQTMRGTSRNGVSRADLEKLQRQLKEDDWNPNL
jgi:hypothetical protein